LPARRHRNRLACEQRHELTDAHLASVPAQHVNELQTDRITERLGDLGHPSSVRALDIGIHHGLTTALASSALALRRQLQIDRHKSRYLD
jgi:hypothetical protein